VRIAVIADIHGNLPALEAVFVDIERRDVDQIINLGDCVSGPL
jgi:predicted phosphodiesterase